MSGKDPIDVNITTETNPLAVKAQEEIEKNGDSTEESNNNSTEDGNKETETQNNNDSKEDKEDLIVEENFNSAKESTGGKLDTETLISEVAKLETNLESKKSNTPDISTFYSNLSDHLTDDELNLKHDDDQSLYLKAVEKAKDNFLKENTTDVSEDEKKLAHAQRNLHTAKAIDTVLKDKDFKDFNFTKLQTFYEEDLTKKQQAELDKGSTLENLPEYLKKIHTEYKKTYPKNIKKKDIAYIPDADDVTKTTVDDKTQIKDQEKDKEFKNKSGFRKL